MSESKIDRATITIEECSELIQALSKFSRYVLGDKTLRNTKEDIYCMVKEELVDVMICVDKMLDVFEISDEEIDSIMNFKLQRYEKLSQNND